MNANLNRVTLLGRLTRDVEVRYVGNENTPVTDIGIAVNDRVKRSGSWTEETTFADVTIWGRSAEVARDYLAKGSPVLIEGRLKLETWESDGQKRSKLKILCQRMQLLGSPNGQENEAQVEHASVGPIEEEIPF